MAKNKADQDKKKELKEQVAKTGTGKINPWKVTGYKQGQNVPCRVIYAEKDGYAVTCLKDNLPGFIKTANTLKPGDEILGVFVCVHNGRILLSQLFSTQRATKHQLQQTTVNWEEHLNEEDLNAAYEAQAATSRQQRLAQTGEMAYQPPQGDGPQGGYAAGNATTDMPPVNQLQPGQAPDFSQFAPPMPYQQQQQQPSQQQQLQDAMGFGAPQSQPQQQYQPNQYETQPPSHMIQAHANPFQSSSPSQYAEQPSWANPQASQYPQNPPHEQSSTGPFVPPNQMHNQSAPQQQGGYDQQANQYTSGQQAQYAPQQNQYDSGQQNQYVSGQQAQYAPPQQNQYDSGQQNAYGQAPPGPSAYGQPPGQQAYGQPPQQQQPVQQPLQPEQQQWQSEHSQIPAKKFRLRRAIDLVMPPVDQESLESLKSFKIADYDIEWLITDLEGGMRTGCIKATSEQKLSRSAALLYKGRAVGCIYGCKANPEAKPTEESLSSMLSDLEAPDAVVTLYDLPEDCALAMSALFLGYPIDNNPEMTSREYCDFVMKWFGENNSTACLAVTVAQTKSTYLIFVHKGRFCGAFFVEEQQFSREASGVINMFNQHPDAKIEASILNADTLTSGMRFGYSLSMARQKRSGF